MLGKKIDKYKVFDTRKHERHRTTCLVKYQVSGTSGLPRVANLKDIGEGGLRFSTSEALSKGTILEIWVLVPPEQVISAFGRVAYGRRLENGNYHAAVSFIEISKSDQKTLSHFLSHLARDKSLRRLRSPKGGIVTRGKERQH